MVLTPTLGPWVSLSSWVLYVIGVGGCLALCAQAPLAQLEGFLQSLDLYLSVDADDKGTRVSDGAVELQGPWINNRGCSTGWKKAVSKVDWFQTLLIFFFSQIHKTSTSYLRTQETKSFWKTNRPQAHLCVWKYITNPKRKQILLAGLTSLWKPAISLRNPCDHISNCPKK